MNRHILYIINPVAGTRTKKDLEQFIEKNTKEKGIPFRILSSVADGDYSFLYKIILEEKITDIVVAGGDGTVSKVVGSLMNFEPINIGLNFGIIPCGSGNGLAYSAKIPKQPAKALEIIFNGTASAVDGFYINDKFSCMLAGLGFDAKVAYDFTNEPKRGLLTYIKLSLKNFFSMKLHRFEIQTEQMKFETNAYFISVANSNQFGNNFTIAPKASLSDGLLDVVIVASPNKISFVVQTLQQLAGWNKLSGKVTKDANNKPSSPIQKKRGIIYFQTEKLNIVNHSLAPLHIDGEPAETADELKIEVKKKCFRLIQP